MGSDRKSEKKNRKRSSSYSVSEEDESRSKRQRRVEDEDRKNRSGKKDKSRDKESSHKHSNSKRHSGKEKKSKDKQKEKHRKGDRHLKYNFQELSNDDYFSRNNEFATWLKEEKDVFFSDLSSQSAREMFSGFVKAWNNQTLESRYYEGIVSGPRSAHKWKIKA